MWYRGWKFWYDDSRTPYVWRAERYGVTMNHPDQQALVRMIEQRRKEGSYV